VSNNDLWTGWMAFRPVPSRLTEYPLYQTLRHHRISVLQVLREDYSHLPYDSFVVRPVQFNIREGADYYGE